jgi:hypothetical protein
MFAAYEGQAQLVTALLQSAAAMPPDDGRPSSHLQPTSATIAGVECGSDDSSAVGKATTFRLKRQALERGLWWALSQKHTSTCLALIESCPELLKASWLHSSLRTCLSQTRGNIYPVFEAYLRKGGSNQQVYSDLLRLALMDAAVNCDHGADRLRFLIQLGADVNAGQRGFTGDSPLAAAIMRVCTTNIQILLDHGAHVHADPASSESKSALQLAIGEDWSSGDLETCKVLLSYERVQVGGAELCAAVDAGQLDRLQLLLGAERNHIWPLLGSLDTSGVVPKGESGRGLCLTGMTQARTCALMITCGQLHVCHVFAMALFSSCCGLAPAFAGCAWDCDAS